MNRARMLSKNTAIAKAAAVFLYAFLNERGKIQSIDTPIKVLRAQA